MKITVCGGSAAPAELQVGTSHHPYLGPLPEVGQVLMIPTDAPVENASKEKAKVKKILRHYNAEAHALWPGHGFSTSFSSATRLASLACLCAFLGSCGGGSDSAGTGLKQPAAAAMQDDDVAPPGSEAVMKLGVEGGSVELPNLASVSLPPGFLSKLGEIRVKRVDSAQLDLDAENGSDLLGVVDRARYHVVVTGIPTTVQSLPAIPIVLRVPQALARQVRPDTVPGVLAWAIDEKTGEGGESLPAHELLPMRYEPFGRRITAELPTRLLTPIDPLTRKTASTLGASFTVVLVNVRSPAPSSSASVSKGGKSHPEPMRMSADPPGQCGAREWARPLDEFRTTEDFSAPRGPYFHTGIDLVAGPSMASVHAAGSGHVLQFKRQDCACDQGAQNLCSDPYATYSMVLLLDSGDKVAYRNLRLGDLGVPGLADVLGERRCWRDSGDQRFRITQGQVIGTAGPHSSRDSSGLHLEYSPAPAAAQSLPVRANPLCKLVGLAVTPSQGLELASNDGFGLLRMSLTDRPGAQLFVLRKGNGTSEWLPALASPKPPGSAFEPGSDAIIAHVERVISDPSVAVIDDNWIDPASVSLPTDKANVAIRRVGPGDTTLTLTAIIPWNIDANRTAPLGTPMGVPIIMPFLRMKGEGGALCFYVPGLGRAGPFTGSAITFDLQCPTASLPTGAGTMSVSTGPRVSVPTAHSFTLERLTSLRCSLDSSLPSTPAGFNRMDGTGVGRLDGRPGAISFTLKDGERYTQDALAFSMQGEAGAITCPEQQLNVGPGFTATGP